MKFRKKPVVIEAVRYDGEWKTIIDWMEKLVAPGELLFPFGTEPPITATSSGKLSIRTLEGTMTADIGDWIIRGIKGEFYPCSPDIFEATYERVGELNERAKYRYE